MESAAQHALIEKAIEVAELLGSIADDDERERAQDVFEQELNVRQYAISQRDEVGL